MQPDIARYQRQMCLPQIGKQGQQLLQHAKVLCVGAGGLGSPALLYLAAAGIGQIAIVDHDRVELSNLQRQIIFNESHLGDYKAEIAAKQLAQLNSSITITPYCSELTNHNCADLLSSYDVIIDGSDNFATKLLVNDVCYHLNKVLISASVLQFSGHCTVFHVNNGPCYRCLFPTEPSPMDAPNCATAGVIGAMAGMLGTMQAMEAIKIITGQGTSLSGRVLAIDGLDMTFNEYTLKKDPHCALCSTPKNIHTYLTAHTTLPVITLDELSQLNETDYQLLDVRETHERHAEHIGGVHIPLNVLHQHLDQLNKNKQIIVYCHEGPRSVYAAQLLQAQGFDAGYLHGGIACLSNSYST